MKSHWITNEYQIRPLLENMIRWRIQFRN